MSAAQSQVTQIQSLLKEQTGQQEELRGELSCAQDLAQKHEQECNQVTQQLVHYETKLRLIQEQASSTKSAKDTELEVNNLLLSILNITVCNCIITLENQYNF
jgi:chromosome segregation ATPase